MEENYINIDENIGHKVDKIENFKKGNLRLFEKWLFNCRICLGKTDQMVNIFERKNNEISFAEKISKCNLTTSHTIMLKADDCYPKNICSDCITLLENALKFKMLSEQTAQVFNEEVMNSRKVEQQQNTIQKIGYVTVDKNMDNICIGEKVRCDLEENESYTIMATNTLNTKLKFKTKQSGKMEEVEQKARRKRKNRVYIRNYQCEECGFLATCPAALEYHIALRHRDDRPFVCPECSKTFKHQNMLNAHLVVHTPNPVVCETCGKTCKNKKLYANHKTIHTAEKKYQCSFCPYRSHVRKAVKRHETIHTGELNYPCKSCVKKYRTSTLLNKHIREEHHNSIPFPCNYCKKQFHAKDSLRRHLVIHTGEKPFSCPQCPIAYSWYNPLQMHVKTNHPDLNVLDSETKMYKDYLANGKNICKP